MITRLRLSLPPQAAGPVPDSRQQRLALALGLLVFAIYWLTFLGQFRSIDEMAIFSAAESLAKKSKKSAAAAKDDKAKPEDNKPEFTAPQFDTKVIVIGVTPTHNEVAQYVSSLQQCGLLTNVELIFSEVTEIQDREWNKFRVEALIDKNADTREIQPLQKPRMENFISEDEHGHADASKKEGH